MLLMMMRMRLRMMRMLMTPARGRQCFRARKTATPAREATGLSVAEAAAGS
jgi:hypothetical protein